MIFLSEWMEPVLRIMLLVCRVGAFLVMTPIIRRVPVPQPVSIGLILLTAIAFEASGLGPQVAVAPGWRLAVTAIVEIGIGLAMGFVTLIVFEGFRLAGQLIGISMGMAMATLLDPGEGRSMSALAMIYGMFAGLIFLLLDGHHMLFRTLALSYAVAPVGDAHFPTGAGHSLVAMMAATFALGVRIAAPILAAQLLVDLTAGILGRTIPQMPVFFVALPLKMLLSYGIAIIALPLLSVLVDGQIIALEQSILALLRGM